MNQATGIEWTDATSNPLKYRDKATGKTVWACVKHSAGCAHCYAETLALRYGRGGPFTKAEMEKVEPYLCEKETGQLLRSKKLAGKRVFVGDMTDLFGDWVPDSQLNHLFAAFFLRPDVTFQVLTKRADRLAEWATYRNRAAVVQLAAFERDHGYTGDREEHADWFLSRPMEWPLPNVWLGTSVENQAAADARIPHLLRTPAAVRFLSCEPLLEPVNFMRVLLTEKLNREPPASWNASAFVPPPKIHWVIVGGESGNGPTIRPCDVAWVRSLVGQCKAAGVACFVKQLGSQSHDVSDGSDRPNAGTLLDLADRKGGDMTEWAPDLRVRDFPEARP